MQATAGLCFPSVSGLSREDRKAEVLKPKVQPVREEKPPLGRTERVLASLLHLPRGLDAPRARCGGPSPLETGAVHIGGETTLVLAASVRLCGDFQKTLAYGFPDRVVEHFDIPPHCAAADMQRKARSVCPRRQMEFVSDVRESSLQPDT